MATLLPGISEIPQTLFEVLQRYLEEDSLQSDHNQGLPPLLIAKKVFMFLWYMATENSLRDISDKFNVSPHVALRGSIVGAIDGCHITIQKTPVRGVDCINTGGPTALCTVLLNISKSFL
ncbi:unnamed protein product [Boreogadus saida]